MAAHERQVPHHAHTTKNAKNMKRLFQDDDSGSFFPVETCPADVSSSASAPGIATGCCAFGVFAIGLASAGPKGRQRVQLIKMMMSSILGFEG